MAVAVKIEEQEYEFLVQYKRDTQVPMTQALTQAVRYWRLHLAEAKREILARDIPVSVQEER